MCKKVFAILSAALITVCGNGLSVVSYADELTTKDGEIYYLDDNGNVKTGWQTIDGNKYFFQKDGTAVTKSCVINGIRYSFSADGVCHGKYTGRTSSANGSRYYINGVMQKERWINTKSGKKYYVGADGYMTTGWYRAADGWCYFDEKSCQMLTGDVEINGNTYTFSTDGIWNGSANYDSVKIYNTLKKSLSKDDYGGIYLDKNAIIVMSKNDDAVKSLTDELKQLYAPIIVRKCEYSVNELKAVRVHLGKNRKKYGISTIWTDVINNRICVEMKKSNSKLNAYLDTLDSDDIVYIEYTDVVEIYD